MSALFRKAIKSKPKATEQPTYSQPAHFSIVSDDPVTNTNHMHTLTDEPLIRWVEIGGKVFAVTPHTCYSGIQANGEDYYPFYDDDLHTIRDDDLDNYPPGDNYSHPAFQSLRRNTH